MEVEAQRLENLKYKAKLLADLNLQSNPTAKPIHRRPQTTKVAQQGDPRHDTAPVRMSARIASFHFKPAYQEPPNESLTPAHSLGLKKRKRKTDTTQQEQGGEVASAEIIRAGWTRWKATAEPAMRDGDGTFHFDDFPEFTPNKSPEEVIREGCFGGSYFRPLKSRKLGMLITQDWKDLPEEWYSGLDVDKYLTSPSYDPDVNKFKVVCGQSIEEWEANGWIAHEFDIRGWFQWYCRFFLGRRCDDDERQVSRWRKCVGETGRWRRMLLKKYMQMGVREVFDDGEEDSDVSPVMHQTCHHWAYQVRQDDLDRAWRSFTSSTRLRNPD